MRIDLLVLSYQRIGILKPQNSEISGEAFVIRGVLKRLMTMPKPIIFDVGANVGDYSSQLLDTYENTLIYAFEPNAYAFKMLAARLHKLGVRCHNLGLGSQVGSQELFTYRDELHSEHASVYESVLTELHKSKNNIKTAIEMTTIDYFCVREGIDFVDFLKIDTEGSELAVLQGAHDMIRQGRIGPIQFEFNEMNVVSRCFLRDFYIILRGYEFYRVDSTRLIPLGGYDSINEIFKFQNILAIPESMRQYLLS